MLNWKPADSDEWWDEYDPDGDDEMRDPLTYHYPRTLEQAFGPYQRGPVVDPDEPADNWQDALVLWASFIAMVALVVIAINPGGIFNGNT